MTQSITPHKGGRDSRLEIRINSEIKQKLEELARQANMTAADVVEYWVRQAGAFYRIPHEIIIWKTSSTGDEYVSRTFRVRPNGPGNPRWPKRYSVIRYNNSDADHLLETDDLNEAVEACEKAADDFLGPVDLFDSDRRRAYGGDGEGIRDARANKEV